MRSIAKLACKILSDSTRDSRTSCCHPSAQLSFSPRLPSSSAPGVASQCCSELNQWYRRHRTNAYEISQSISDHLRPIQYHVLPDHSRFLEVVYPCRERGRLHQIWQATYISLPTRLLGRLYMAQPCPTARFGSHMLVLWNPNMTQTISCRRQQYFQRLLLLLVSRAFSYS